MTGAVRHGQLAENVVRFCRLLRDAGLPVGPDRTLDALRALAVSGVARRDDFYWTLAAVLIDRREQFELFEQAFRIYWGDAESGGLALPGGRAGEEAQAANAGRLAEALVRQSATAAAPPGRRPAGVTHTALAPTDAERLRSRDFDAMTQEELRQTRRLIAGLRLPIPMVSTRRMRPDPRGRAVDLRASLRASLRGNGDILPLRHRSRRRRHPPLVVLCDVSGSMGRYSRMLLHFLHAITNDRDRVHTFVFGTRLTNVTRHLQHRDVDLALDAVSKAVVDWSGGTRIGAAIREFNLRWSRRMLGQNAVVLLISDGLDRDPGLDLSQAMERLHKSCRKLVWLNPLLRFEGFEPLATGVKLMLPHVDAFLPAHNVDSLTDLARALAPGPIQ
jgi:uncharacterized protein